MDNAHAPAIPGALRDVDEEDSSFSFGPHIPTKLTGGGDEKSFPTIHEVNESLATTETEISWGTQRHFQTDRNFAIRTCNSEQRDKNGSCGSDPEVTWTNELDSPKVALSRKDCGSSSPRRRSWKKIFFCICAEANDHKVFPAPTSGRNPEDGSRIAESASERPRTDDSIGSEQCEGSETLPRLAHNSASVNFTASTSTNSPPKEHSLRTTVASIRSAPAKPAKLLLPPKAGNKPCLVLDLDETLVHSSTEIKKGYDFCVEISLNDKLLKIYVIKRPFLQEFLEALSHHYEIGIFTASLREYAEQVIKEIDPNKMVRWTLYRDSCSIHEGLTIKDLERIPRPVERMLIVDDKETAFSLHPSNGILCRPFLGNRMDTELARLRKTLVRISQSKGDIRKELRQVKCCGEWNDYVISQSDPSTPSTGMCL